jgi:predicted esterase
VGVPAPSDARAWAIAYHSVSATGQDVAVSGLLLAPAADAPEAGYPVLAWAHGTTGSAPDCAPSRSAFSGSLMGDDLLLGFVRQGYTVVASDYEGLGIPGLPSYLLGISEARSVLDAIRAARSFPAIHTSDRTVLFGYSQGGHAVLWTVGIADRYAPDVQISRAVAMAPVADMTIMVRVWARDGLQPYLLAALDAWDTTSELSLRPLLTQRGRKARAQIQSRCFADLDWATYRSGLFRTHARAWRPWLQIARRNTPRTAPGSIPILIQHGDADTLVPISSSEAVGQVLCAAGASVTFRVYPGADHDLPAAAMPDAMRWLAGGSVQPSSRGPSCTS